MFTAELVDAAITKHDRGERRRRLLSARLVVYFVLALCLFARESYEEVLRVLTSGIPGSRALARVNRSSLCRARARLGEDVLETVFRQVAGPLATPATPGAWWRELRLLALDGTQFDLPDSTSNGDTFDGPSTTGGVPFGFPQVRAVVLAEIGTHGVLDARLGGYRDGERSLAYPLAGSTGPGDLVIADRGSRRADQVTDTGGRPAGTVGLPRGPPRHPPVRPHSRTYPTGRGHRPCLLPEVRPHHPFPARSDRHQAHPLLRRGRAGGTRTPPPGPARPGLPTRDQEAEPLARPEDPRQARHRPARPLGAQPDHEAEEQPPSRKTGTQGNPSLVTA
ncbi:transposase domain-containing protein [Streptomyces sp. LMG1-1-1.1]